MLCLMLLFSSQPRLSPTGPSSHSQTPTSCGLKSSTRRCAYVASASSKRYDSYVTSNLSVAALHAKLLSVWGFTLPHVRGW